MIFPDLYHVIAFPLVFMKKQSC